MKRFFAILVVIMLVAACQNENNTNLTQASEQEKISDQFNITTANADAVRFENLAIFPVLATEETPSNDWVGLEEALENERFRITEKKPYGRNDDSGAVNTLTVQNRSEDVVFMIPGDVVQGGNQDRVIAQHLVIPPRTITDVTVFCVEKGRWSPREVEETEVQTEDNKIFAFRGYYNVASNSIRKTLSTSKSQEEVWAKVADITHKHNADVATNAYAGLESAEDFTNNRTAYLEHFASAFVGRDNVVGFVAVSGNEVIGADIFSNADLFHKKFEALLHSYITDALTTGEAVDLDQVKMKEYADYVAKALDKGEHTFKYEGEFVHFSNSME
ncbi:MAG: DUF6569 family protein [Bacteroidota bacterium]